MNDNKALIHQNFNIADSGNVNDFAAIELLRITLNKKLYNNIREKQGLAYSVWFKL